MQPPGHLVLPQMQGRARSCMPTMHGARVLQSLTVRCQRGCSQSGWLAKGGPVGAGGILRHSCEEQTDDCAVDRPQGPPQVQKVRVGVLSRSACTPVSRHAIVFGACFRQLSQCIHELCTSFQCAMSPMNGTSLPTQVRAAGEQDAVNEHKAA